MLADTKGEDRSFNESLISSVEHPEDIIVDLAVIFRSLGGGGEIRQTDILTAIDFLDYADTLRIELRRKE